jgi:hypothetical protein
VFADREAREAYERKVAELEVERGSTRSAIAAIEAEFLQRHPVPEAQRTDLAALMGTSGREVLGDATFDRLGSLRERLTKLLETSIPVDRALVVSEAGGVAPDTHVLLRGNPGSRGDRVEPGFPEVLRAPAPVLAAPMSGSASCGRRLALADWMVSPGNPLAPRVMVNRLWQHHFGRGLVRSPNNLGLQGDAPTHPDLLDWLAAEFVDRGWSLKAIHRLILGSNTYRMSSRGRADALAADVENTLFWRFNMRRLSAEEIRDSILAVTGDLNPAMYGPSVYVDLPKAVLATQSVPGSGWGTSPLADQARRSLYIHAKRSLRVPLLDGFDLAESDRTTPVRFASVQPTQALGMINSDFLQRQARRFAERLRAEAPGDARAQVRRGFSLVTSRAARDVEVEAGLALLQAWRGGTDAAVADRALEGFCLLLLNLNEFIYLD